MKVFAAVVLACLMALSLAQPQLLGRNRGSIRHIGGGLSIVQEPGSVELGFDRRTGRIRAFQRPGSQELVFTGFTNQRASAGQQQGGFGGSNNIIGF